MWSDHVSANVVLTLQGVKTVDGLSNEMLQLRLLKLTSKASELYSVCVCVLYVCVFVCVCVYVCLYLLYMCTCMCLV